MRQLFTLAALLSLALTSAPGCRSLDGYQTAADRNRPDASAGNLAARSPMITLQRIEPANFDSIEHSPVPIALVGIIADDSEPSPPPADTKTFDPIDIVPQPQPVPAGDWGHSKFSDRQAESNATCRDCNSGRRGYRPDELLTWTGRPPVMYEHLSHPAMHAIRIGDELEIKFPHKPLFSEKVMVREDGMIAVPLIEPVLAAGLTPEMLQDELARKYRTLQYDPSANRTRAVDKKYLLSVNDKLDIRFDANGADSPLDKLSDSVTIRPDGKISLPLIGTLIAEGKTPEELEAEVATRYQKFYKEAAPVLIVREFTNNSGSRRWRDDANRHEKH